MDRKLEAYLQTVEQELGSLESEQRTSELREMRQHIEAIVARLVEGGLSQSEATEAAIAQFGAARQVGRELNHASAERDSGWRVLAAAIGAVASYNLLLFIFTLTRGWDTGTLFTLGVILYGSFPFLSGAVAGCIASSPRGRTLACLCAAASAFHSGSWYMWWSSSFILGFLLFAGACLGMRWPLPFELRLERRKSTRA